jgi:hypothetical protein
MSLWATAEIAPKSKADNTRVLYDPRRLTERTVTAKLMFLTFFLSKTYFMRIKSQKTMK